MSSTDSKSPKLLEYVMQKKINHASGPISHINLLSSGLVIELLHSSETHSILQAKNSTGFSTWFVAALCKIDTTLRFRGFAYWFLNNFEYIYTHTYTLRKFKYKKRP